LEKWWETGKLDFDIESALKLNNELYLQDLEAGKEYPIKTFNARSILLDSCYNKVTHFNGQFYVDNTGHRLYTPLTNLKSKFRQYLTYDGKPMGQIDIVNSQPYLAISLLNKDSYERNNMRERIAHYNEHLRDEYSNKDPIMFRIFNKDKYSDIQHYIDLASSGKFYEGLSKKLYENGVMDQLDRNTAKTCTYEVFFSRNNVLNIYPAKRFFSQQYPTVYDIFKDIKRKKHNALACVLQNLEADLILWKICKRITDERPHIPLFTIHDSIASTVDHLDYIYSVMEEELANSIGYKPHLKREVWFD